jgi:hypothetical protein
LKVYAYYCMIMQPARVRSRDDLQGRAAGRGAADRGEAIRCYESLGFEASHEGLKLPL